MSSADDHSMDAGGPLASIGLLFVAIIVGYLVWAYSGLGVWASLQVCGRPPSRTLEFEAFIAFGDCVRSVEHRVTAIVSFIFVLAFGWVASRRQRRTAREDKQREDAIDAELARMRSQQEPR